MADNTGLKGYSPEQIAEIENSVKFDYKSVLEVDYVASQVDDYADYNLQKTEPANGKSRVIQNVYDEDDNIVSYRVFEVTIELKLVEEVVITP